MEKSVGSIGVNMLKAVKDKIDPKNTFGNGNMFWLIKKINTLIIFYSNHSFWILFNNKYIWNICYICILYFIQLKVILIINIYIIKYLFKINTSSQISYVQ